MPENAIKQMQTSARPPLPVNSVNKWRKWALDDLCELTMRGALRLLKDDSIPLLDRVRVCAPFVLKRMPERQEVTQLNVTINDTTASRLAELLAESNALRARLAESATESAQVVAPQSLTTAGANENQVDSGGTPTP